MQSRGGLGPADGEAGAAQTAAPNSDVALENPQRPRGSGSVDTRRDARQRPTHSGSRVGQTTAGAKITRTADAVAPEHRSCRGAPQHCSRIAALSQHSIKTAARWHSAVTISQLRNSTEIQLQHHGSDGAESAPGWSTGGEPARRRHITVRSRLVTHHITPSSVAGQSERAEDRASRTKPLSPDVVPQLLPLLLSMPHPWPTSVGSSAPPVASGSAGAA